MRIVALHLRTGPVPWLSLVALAADLAVLLTGSRFWVGIWPQAGAKAQVPAYFLALLVVGLAAWTSGARRRHRLDEQVAAAAVPRTSAEALRFLAVLCVALVPYLIGQVVAFALTARTSPPGVALWGAYAGMGVILLVLAASFGWLLGKYLGSAVASLLAVMVWFVVTSFVPDTTGLFVLSGPPHLAPSTWGLLARSAAVVVLALVVLWAPPRGTEWSRPRLSRIVIAPTVLVAVVATVPITPGIVQRPIPADPLCAQGQPTLCLWPEDAKYLPEFSRLQTRVEALPEGFLVPDRLDEFGLEEVTYHDNGQTTTQREGAAWFPDGRPSIAAESVAARIITENTKGCDVDLIANHPADFDSLYRWLELRLADTSPAASRRGSSPSSSAGDGARIAEDVYATRTPAEQEKWATRKLQQFRQNFCGI